jgi:hypothetical protein
VNPATPFGIIPEWLLYSSVSGAAIKLYGILARHADNNGHGAFPSVSRLASLASLSTRTVQRRLEELVTIGAIEQGTRFAKSGKQSTNRYRLIHTVPLEQLSLLIDTETERKKKPPEIRRADPMWQVLEEMFGTPPKNARYRSGWGVAVTELREQGATPAQIRTRVLEGRQAMGFQWAVSTPAALAKHWSVPIGAEQLANQARGRAWADQFARKGAS